MVSHGGGPKHEIGSDDEGKAPSVGTTPLQVTPARKRMIQAEQAKKEAQEKEKKEEYVIVDAKALDNTSWIALLNHHIATLKSPSSSSLFNIFKARLNQPKIDLLAEAKACLYAPTSEGVANLKEKVRSLNVKEETTVLLNKVVDFCESKLNPHESIDPP